MKRIISFIIVMCLILSIPGLPMAARNDLLLPATEMQQGVEKWGYINEAGRFVIKAAYDNAGEFNSKGIAMVSDNVGSGDKWNVRFIDRTGATVAGPFISLPAVYNNGVAILLDETYGCKVVDENGKVVLESKYYLYNYQEGLFTYQNRDGKGNEIYGYMDITGKIVIPAKYFLANPFKDGWACVFVSEGKGCIIDRKGTVLFDSENPYSIYNNRAEGLSGYPEMNSDERKFGYMTDDGKIAIEPVFDEISPFQDGYAVVGTINPEYKTHYGLIDKNGKYVIPSEYGSIAYIGNGLYLVCEKFNYSRYFDSYFPKAIFNSKGEKLTDFQYYAVAKFNNGYASACGKDSTFFIDTSFHAVSTLPELSGIGKLTLMDDVIKAEIDGSLQYYKTDGSLIWKTNDTVSLEDNIKVTKQRYRPDVFTYIEYPAVSGMADEKIQLKVNSYLKTNFTDAVKGLNQSEGEYQDIDIRFNVWKNKNLLIVEESGYYYFIGAAHGMPTIGYYFIDLATGEFYQLDDLFKAGSKYADRLTSLVRKQIALNVRTNKIMDSYYYFDENPEVTVNHDFFIEEDALVVYYAPYELACYAAGFQYFSIPYGQILDLIDTEGAFWNAFDKTIVNNKINTGIYDDIDSSTAETIGNVVKAYESGIVDAINNNSFSKVEGTLKEGSNLYNAQKKLVPYLYGKDIKEKLKQYDIYAIEYDYANKVYKVFTIETVAVKYPGKSFVDKSYYWCYDAVYDKDSESYKLSEIKAW